MAQAPRSVDIPYRTLVVRADPEFEREKRREPEYETTKRTFYADRSKRGAYTPAS